MQVDQMGDDRFSASIGWRESDLPDDGPIASICMEEVISGIGLDPEQERRVLAEALLEQLHGPFPVAELGIKKRQFDRRYIG